jgi:hypothetical protein
MWAAYIVEIYAQQQHRDRHREAWSHRSRCPIFPRHLGKRKYYNGKRRAEAQPFSRWATNSKVE